MNQYLQEIMPLWPLVHLLGNTEPPGGRPMGNCNPADRDHERVFAMVYAPVL